ncbi:hypothetical protein ACV355_32845, partial [Pseudomonas aeruginosa]
MITLISVRLLNRREQLYDKRCGLAIMRNNFLFGDKHDMNSLFASTARGLEELLKSELEALGAHDCKVVQGGVHFQGDDRLLYQSLLWSRLASRILLP